MLPGEIQPRPHRSLAAIACHRLRQPEAGDKSKRKRKADDAGLDGTEDSVDDTGMTQDEEAEKGDGGSGNGGQG